MVIGCDIEEIARFSSKDAAFYEKLFTKAEIAYCESRPSPAQHFAVRYCAKEATVKALHSIGAKNIYYKDIEITKDGNTPRIVLPGFAVSVSLSHTKDYAFATVLVSREGAPK
jgi:holo-[acyl-carrier protein] synthase